MFALLTVVFTFQVFFSVLCVTLIPSGVQSRGFRSDKKSNITRSSADRSSHKFQTHQPRKHTLRNKRPAVHVKERGPVKLTKFPTNSKQVRLFGRVGLFLHCNANGTISGSLNQFSKFGKYNDRTRSSVFFISIQSGDVENFLSSRSTVNVKCVFWPFS